MRKIQLLIIIIFVNLIYSAPSGHAMMLADEIIEIQKKRERKTLEKRFDEYISKSGLQKEAVACSLFTYIKDIKKNRDEWEKPFPKYQNLDGRFESILTKIKYEPVQEFLVDNLRNADCLVQHLILKDVFDVSKKNWYNICDSIIRDTNTFCDNTRWYLYHKILPKYFLADTMFINTNKESIFKLFLNGLRLEDDPENILFIDSLCCQLNHVNYEKSIERATFLKNTLVMPRVQKIILLFHPLRQKEVNKRIEKMLKILSKKKYYLNSPIMEMYFSESVIFIEKK